MRNKKFWLILKGFMILMLTAVIFLMPTEDNFRKWFRFILLIVFTISFLIDLNNYRKSNA